ncbi:MAG: hypothetical protein ACE5HP_03855 [Gemmatimonadota bacterium]
MVKHGLLLVSFLVMGFLPVGRLEKMKAGAGPPTETGSARLTEPTGQTPPRAQEACADSAHRQFDFWLGEWEVTNPAGKAAGTNRITRILGGCVLREEFTSASGGYAGTSLNIYDAAGGRWHQTWVDTRGLLLRLDGGLRDGRMVLEGDRVDRQGRSVRDRITWEALEGGRVRQVWTVSRDGGESWSRVFEGIYSRFH